MPSVADVRRILLTTALLGLSLSMHVGIDPASGESGEPEARSVLIDGAETPRPQLAQVMSAAARDGSTEIEAVDRWLAAARSESANSFEIPQLDNLTDAEVQDLRAIAVQQGQAFSTVAQQYGSQEEFQEASWRLEEMFPGSYAGMRYRDHGDTHWMGFDGEIPAKALDLIRELPGDVMVEAGDLLPKVKWGGTVAAAQRQVADIAGPSVVRFDSEYQRLEVAVKNDVTASDEAISAAVANAAHVPAAVQRTLKDIPDTEDGTMRGGALIYVLVRLIYVCDRT